MQCRLRTRADLSLRLLDLVDSLSDGIPRLLVLFPLPTLFGAGSFLLCAHCLLLTREGEGEEEEKGDNGKLSEAGVVTERLGAAT